MTRIHKTAFSGLLWLTFTAALSATPLTIVGQNFNVDGGGRFSAYLNNDPAQSLQVFCVDYRNTVGSETFDVNIDTLPNTLDARYGITPQASFSYQTAPNAMSLGNAMNRYLLAGWLTTQYDFTPGAGTGTRDLGIQNAIWNMLDTNNVNHTDGAVGTWLNNATVWESGQTATALAAFASEVRIYTSTNVSPDLDLNNNDRGNRYSIGKQEMINVVPEPGVMMLVGSGLVTLGLLRRRKKQ